MGFEFGSKDKRLKERITLRLNQETLELLKSQDINPSELARTAIFEYLKKVEGKNDNSV